MINIYSQEIFPQNQNAGDKAFPALLQTERDSILELCYPQEGKVRARKIVTRSKARSTGKYPSWKMGRMMQWESHHELNAFRLADTDPKVKGFYEQPLTITYWLDGELHHHTPDILAIKDRRKELWEVKPAIESLCSATRQRTEFLTSALPAFGYHYRVVFGDELAQQPVLSNAIDVLKYGRRPISLATRERLRVIFSSKTEPSWQELAQGSADFLHGVCRLILEGVITLDMKKPITAQTLLGWNSSEHRNNGKEC